MAVDQTVTPTAISNSGAAAMLIGDLVAQAAALRSAAPAVWHKGQWFTYGEIEAAANRLAAALCGLGVQAGDRVALLAENSPNYIIAHFAVHKAGAVEVSLNHDLKGEALRWMLQHCGARVLIVASRLWQKWQAEIAGVRSLEHVVVEGSTSAGRSAAPAGPTVHAFDAILEKTDSSAPSRRRNEDDLAAIVYTSGSTGEPKGVMLSHRNLISNAHAVAHYLELTADDRMLVVLPFHYIYGRSLLYTHFLTGGALILDNRFAFPAIVLDTMQQQSATALAGVPSTFSILLHRTNVRERKFPHLRTITQAGGGMSVALQQQVAEAFAPARLFVMYGATEAGPRLSYVEPEMLPRKWGSIGRPVQGVELAVLDEQGARLPAGQVGEITARGPNIMLGYWQDPAGTARVLRNGRFHTGDLGYVDGDGYFYLTGRAQEMIKTGGNRVSAKEIEDALLALAGVVEAAVIPVPDEILGEAIQAFVVPKSAAVTENELLRELARRLPAFKLPKAILLRSALPKSSSGKVLKPLLLAGAGLRRNLN